MPNLVRFEHVEKIYTHQNQNIHALHNINLQIPQGSIFGIIGKSGAGKSTLLRCINLLEKPTGGKIYIDNQDITTISAQNLRNLRKNIGMIFQHFNLLSTRTVFENIILPLELAHKKISANIDHIYDLLNLVGLTEKKDFYPHHLSGGQKQRVAIARALATHPKILLCDEATSALDPQTTKAILKLLQDINRCLGITIIIITHEMDVIKQICDYVALIDQGRIIETATIYDFFANPQHSLSQTLVHDSLSQQLPDHIQQRLSADPDFESKPVFNIYFYERSAGKPIISQLTNEFDVEINILQAKIEFIKAEPLGVMTIELMNGFERLEKIIRFLEEHHIRVEILGYLKYDI